MVQPLLETKAVVKRFGGLVAVNGIDFTVDEGVVYSIIGPNGAGKSTFLNMISGMLRLDLGSVFFNGERISGLRAHQIVRRGIGRTFQVLRLFGAMSVRDNVALGYYPKMKSTFWNDVLFDRAARHDLERARVSAERSLRFVGLENCCDQTVSELPIGQHRLVDLAKALAGEPKLLLLDEPFSGLTPGEARNLVEVFKKIKALNIAMVVVEHRVGIVFEISDRVTAISFGKKIAEGPPAAVRADANVIAAYLGKAHGHAVH